MSDKVIAHPPGECCVQGSLHEGNPQGKIVQILDVDTYIATPPANTANGNIVLFFPDVFGHFPNNKLLMDAFARAGYLTLGPDYFRGDPVWKYKNFDDPNDNPDFDIGSWATAKKEFADPWVPKFVEEVRRLYGTADTKYGCVGYCFGAPYVMDQLSEKGICSAGAFAHPGFLLESHFENLKSPLFLSCAEIDFTFPQQPRRRAVDLMDEHKKAYSLQLFHGVSHGFAVRGDMKDPWQRYTKEASFEGIRQWFDSLLTK